MNKIRKKSFYILLSASLLLSACGVASFDSGMQESAEKRCAISMAIQKSYLTCVQENTGRQIARGEKSVDKIDGSVMSACEPLVRNFLDAETQCAWAGSYVPGKGLKLNRSQSHTIALNAALHVKMKALGELRKKEKAAGLKI